MRKPTIAIAHPGLLSGGSEIKALWLMEALNERYEVTLLTGRPVAWDRLNHFGGTNLSTQQIKVRLAPMPSLLTKMAAGDALRGAYFARFLRSVGKDYDLCISSYNFAPFGRPAIQFIADFSWDDEIRRAYDPVSHGLRGVLQRPTPLRVAYLGLCAAIGGGHFYLRDHSGDVIIANSRWTADILKQYHGIAPRVIYPPVYAPTLSAGHNGSGDFVMLGRISPEKRVLEAIDLLARVRARGHCFQFHIIGPLDDSNYSRSIRYRAKQEGAWVRLRGSLYGDDKFRELGHHSFGLHMRQREAFGIVIVEMIKMGVVPFVPASSAPIEIIDNDNISFTDSDHAVDVIDRVLRDPQCLAHIREGLKARAELFAAEHFVANIRSLVEDWFSNRAKP